MASVVQQTNVNQGLGLTPGKLAIIGVLSVVLVGVLYLQFGGSEAEVAPTKPGRKARTAAAASAAPSTAQPDQKRAPATALVDISAWDTPDLEAVIQYDPFALPAAFPQPKVVAAGLELTDGSALALANAKIDEETRAKMLLQIEGELGQMRRQGVQVILTRGDQFVAMIGGKTYNVGDEIDGFTITAIDANGVHVERAIQE